MGCPLRFGGCRRCSQPSRGSALASAQTENLGVLTICRSRLGPCKSHPLENSMLPLHLALGVGAGLGVGLLTRPAMPLGFNGGTTRIARFLSRTYDRVRIAFLGWDEMRGGKPATFPGGGEPSAVKSDFSCASDFATGTGVTTAWVMRMPFTLRTIAPCRVARKCRLSLSAQSVNPGGQASCSTWRSACGLRLALLA